AAPDLPLYTFLADGEREAGTATAAEIELRSRGVAARLTGAAGDVKLAAGERALLLYPAGLDFLPAFFGCLDASIVAVPAPPPEPARLARTLGRLLAILRDAQPAVALTTAEILAVVEGLFAQAPELAALRWLVAPGDGLAEPASDKRRGRAPGRDTLAYLQYTSGSTSAPKGVMVSHANLLASSETVRTSKRYSVESRAAVWVPNFHDDGLVQGILQPLYTGCRAWLLPPLAVVQRPERWLRAISRHRATHA